MVVSIGDDNDNGLLVWETVSPRIISANLVKNSTINGVAFLPPSVNQNEIEFLTFGTNSHLKLWTIAVEKDQYITAYYIKEG